MTIAEEAKINKWFNYHLFYELVAGKKYKKHIEIGVEKGHSVTFLAQAVLKRKGVEIFAVDTFEPHMKALYDYNKSRLPEKVQDILTEIKGKSVEVAGQFEDGFFDFVFIDADHAYESVIADILAWLPKVKAGGMIAGHDYVESQPGVRKAVDELFGDNKNVQIDYDTKRHEVGGKYILEKFPKSYVWYVELDGNMTGEGR